eukprot:4155531-Amphidinium_carterae.1
MATETWGLRNSRKTNPQRLHPQDSLWLEPQRTLDLIGLGSLSLALAPCVALQCQHQALLSEIAKRDSSENLKPSMTTLFRRAE